MARKSTPTMRDKLKSALDTTKLSFARYAWSRDHFPTGDYGVYAEDGENALIADQTHTECSMRFTVDYFTRDDSDAIRTTIETALDAFSWYLNSVQYEDDTGYIHYEWVVEV